MRKFIRNFFGFSRVETNGFVVLFVIIIITLFSEPIYRKWRYNRLPDYTAENRYLDSLVATWAEPAATTKPKRNHLHKFNPNNSTYTELVGLGFSGPMAARIINYRNKGGHFRIKKDLLKMYGMDSVFFYTLTPFILLPEVVPELKKELTYRTDYKKETVIKKEPLRFDINQADTAQLKSIYGIGPTLANRIIKYRNALGGFVTIDQLREIYGLDSVVISRMQKKAFIASDFQTQKININTATEQQLAAHPHLSKSAARAIVAYRFQHGKFYLPDDLKKIRVLDSATLRKLYPYISME